MGGCKEWKDKPLDNITGDFAGVPSVEGMSFHKTQKPFVAGMAETAEELRRGVRLAGRLYGSHLPSRLIPYLIN